MQAYNDCEGESMNFWERDLHSNNQNQQNKQSNAVNSSSYTNCQPSSNVQQTEQQNANFNVMEHIARLSTMSDEDRMKELTKTVSGMKQEGKFNATDLERVYQTAGMFMTTEQLARLRTLIDMLK